MNRRESLKTLMMASGALVALPSWAIFSSTARSFSIYTYLAIGFNAGTYTFYVTGTIPSGTTATITGDLLITAPPISISGTDMES